MSSASTRNLTVERYLQRDESGVLGPDDRVELCLELTSLAGASVTIGAVLPTA